MRDNPNHLYCMTGDTPMKEPNHHKRSITQETLTYMKNPNLQEYNIKFHWNPN